jgi:phosphoribosylglycinamide formyltransferase-1
VLSDRSDAYALERARQAGVPTAVVPRKGFASRDEHDAAIADRLEQAGADWVVLAGYMRLLSAPFVARFRDRIVNIHPALLPAFPGTHAQADALAYGVKVSGCTVHLVDEGVDSGPIIAQRTVPVEPDDTEDSLAERILREEHRLYPEVLGWLVAGRVQRRGRHVWVI